MKWRLCALVLVAACFVACDQPFAPETAIVQGTLQLSYYYYDPVPAVDANGALVRLYDNSDFTGTPIATITARPNADNDVVFRFDGVQPGTYYVQAWKDLDSNGIVNGGDLYGVYVQTYGEPPPVVLKLQAWPYEPDPLHVARGTDYRLEISLGTYPPVASDLTITASGSRSGDKKQTTFSYQVNLAVVVDSARVRFPSGNSALAVRGIRLDPGQQDSLGPFTAPTDTMPAGEHVLTFYGQTNINGPWTPMPFSKEVRVSVP